VAAGSEATAGRANAVLTLAAMTLSSSMILVDQIAVTLATPEVLAALGGAVSEGQWIRTANILALACALFGAFHRRRWPPDAGGAFGARARHHHPGPPGPCLSPMGRFLGGAHAVGSGLWPRSTAAEQPLDPGRCGTPARAGGPCSRVTRGWGDLCVEMAG
jgi:hypothetical protein